MYNLRNQSIDFDYSPQYIAPEIHYGKLQRSVLYPGDLLMNIVGPPLGKLAIIPDCLPESNTNQAAVVIRPLLHKDIINKYLFYYLEEMTEIESITTKGSAGQVNISLSQSKMMRIPLPPLHEQERILLRIEQWTSFCDRINSSEKELRQLIIDTKAKILDQAIHGKLVPQNTSEESALILLQRFNPAFRPSDNLHYGESLPTGWICATYGMMNQHKNRSINPMDSPQDSFELYSVPTYDSGKPEYLSGKEIGSTKQLVERGDVLLCKINPHLNRAWIVEHNRSDLKCIASSEWLIFKSDALYPEYARIFFMSPAFRSLMLSNVSGVGGSLMRARASAVDGYTIWVPPFNEQKRIVKAVKAYYKVLEEIVAGLD